MVTAEQLRAARAMLRLSQRQLADMAHISTSAIRRMERTSGDLPYSKEIILVVQSALEAAGIRFIDPGMPSPHGGPGIRLEGDVVAGDNITEIDVSAETEIPKEVVATNRPVQTDSITEGAPADSQPLDSTPERQNSTI